MALTDEGLVPTSDLLSRWVSLSTGVRAHYMTAGSSGPAILMLHGGLNGSSGLAGWREVAPALSAQGFRVYCPDFPAYGLTVDRGGRVYGYGLDALVRFVDDFVDAVGLDTFHLVGNSLGCNVGAHYIVNNTDRVLTFTGIAGAFGDVVPNDPVLVPANRGNVNITFDGTAESMRVILEGLVLDKSKVTDDLVEMRTLAANNQSEDYPHMIGQFFRDARGEGDANDSVRHRTAGRLNEITTPAIYIYGAKDTLHPVEHAYFQEECLPNFQVFYPPHCGHQSQTDDPALHTQIIVELIRDKKISAATAKAMGVSDRRPVSDLVEH